MLSALMQDKRIAQSPAIFVKPKPVGTASGPDFDFDIDIDCDIDGKAGGEIGRFRCRGRSGTAIGGISIWGDFDTDCDIDRYGRQEKSPSLFRGGLIVFELTYVSDGADVRRFGAFTSPTGHKLDLLPFLKCPKTIRKDVRVMNEEIFPAIIGSYEAIAFLVVEPLNGTCAQTTFSSGSCREPC